MARSVLNKHTLIESVTDGKEFSSEQSLKEFVHGILENVGYLFDFSPTPIDKIESLFNVKIDRNKRCISDAELLKSLDGWIVRLQSGPDSRLRFSRAHELAHIFLISLVDKGFESEIINRNRLVSLKLGRELETLCNQIAAELIAPSTLFADKTFRELERTLLQFIKFKNIKFPRDGTEIVDGRPNFSLNLLSCLCLKMELSLPVILLRLHHSRILDSSETGFILSTEAFNVNTGRKLALRVNISSLPSWGYIPKNVRLANIGMNSAIDAFNTLTMKKRFRWNGCLNVTEKSSKNSYSEPRWCPKKVLNTYGEHTVAGDTAKGRSIISSLNWPKPDTPDRTR
jgi:hypothetical protein